MSLSYGPLTLRDDGSVYLDDLTSEDDPRPIYMGHIEGDDPTPALERPWSYLLDLYRDGRRAAAGYEAAVNTAWFARF